MRPLVVCLACLLSTGTALPDEAVERPTVIASEADDFDGDGRMDTLEIVQVSGRKYVDHDIWCGGSIDDEPKVEGKFVARVRLHGKKAVDTDLNELLPSSGDLWFRGTDWPIYIARLGGAPGKQFTLGQYGSCSTWSYYVFGVTRGGTVVSLSPELFNGDRQNSTRLARTKRGFAFWEIGAPDEPTKCVEYRWSDKRRAFLPVSPSKACD